MKQNLSQPVLLEIVMREIEALKTANKEVARAYELAKKQSDRLETTKIIAQVDTTPLQVFNKALAEKLQKLESVAKVDTTELEAFRTKLAQQVKDITTVIQVDTKPLDELDQKLLYHTERMKRGLNLPRWLVYAVIGMGIWATLATGLGVWFYRNSDEKEEEARYFEKDRDQYKQRVDSLKNEVAILKGQSKKGRNR